MTGDLYQCPDRDAGAVTRMARDVGETRGIAAAVREWQARASTPSPHLEAGARHVDEAVAHMEAGRSRDAIGSLSAASRELAATGESSYAEGLAHHADRMRNRIADVHHHVDGDGQRVRPGDNVHVHAGEHAGLSGIVTNRSLENLMVTPHDASTAVQVDPSDLRHTRADE